MFGLAALIIIVCFILLANNRLYNELQEEKKAKEEGIDTYTLERLMENQNQNITKMLEDYDERMVKTFNDNITEFDRRLQNIEWSGLDEIE